MRYWTGYIYQHWWLVGGINFLVFVVSASGAARPSPINRQPIYWLVWRSSVCRAGAHGGSGFEVASQCCAWSLRGQFEMLACVFNHPSAEEASIADPISAQPSTSPGCRHPRGHDYNRQVLSMKGLRCFDHEFRGRSLPFLRRSAVGALLHCREVYAMPARMHRRHR